MSLKSKNLRFSRTPLLFKIFVVLVPVIALLAPMNFVLLTPGPVTNLFPKVLTISKASGVKTYPVNGKLYLLTVYVTNPETMVFGVQVATCWAQGDCVAKPRSAFYEKNTTNSAEKKSGKKDMVESQNIALQAAVAAVNRKFPNLKLGHIKDSAVKVSLKDTGGPSGGLVFTLGLVDLLTPTDLLQGRKIAGTGTISSDGQIGPIGGVTEKIIGARKAGANVLFVSTENCFELPAKVEGISVVAIENIDQAIDYLLATKASVNSAGIRGCASVGA